MDSVPGANIFEAAQKVENLALSLGRRQMANDVLRVLSEEKNDGRAIARVVALCTREAK